MYSDLLDSGLDTISGALGGQIPRTDVATRRNGPSASSGSEGLIRCLFGARGRFELPPLPPEGEKLVWNGANQRELPRDFNVFGSSLIASKRLVFRDVLPFCCYGRVDGPALALPERPKRRRKIWNQNNSALCRGAGIGMKLSFAPGNYCSVARFGISQLAAPLCVRSWARRDV